MKFEAVRLHFLSDVFVAVAVVVLRNSRSNDLFLGNVSLCASEHLPLLCDCHWDREGRIWKQSSWEFYAVKSSFRPFFQFGQT